MKKTKIILLATLGMCIISFMPAVVAKADARPISAFTDTNVNVAAWADPESGLSVFPHGFFLFGLNGLESIAELDHHGSVLVKDLKDGRILYKVNLHVKGALLFVTYDNELIFEGEMDYNFQATMIIYDGELSDSVPNLLHIWFPGFFGIDPPIGESPFVHITGSGAGTFTALGEVLGFGFEGDFAKVKINQVGFIIPEDHPQSDPEYEPYMYPVEFIFFH